MVGISALDAAIQVRILSSQPLRKTRTPLSSFVYLKYKFQLHFLWQGVSLYFRGFWKGIVNF